MYYCQKVVERLRDLSSFVSHHEPSPLTLEHGNVGYKELWSKSYPSSNALKNKILLYGEKGIKI